MANAALDLAARMRWLMAQDIEEFALAEWIENEDQRFNDKSPTNYCDAWQELSATERTAWRGWLSYRKMYERK
jgi:hypothetical protein